jgi:hypothetical protein
MCAGCPGGRAVSKTTAYLNLHGMKSAVLKELQRSVGPRAMLSVFGDQWMLASRTGRRQMFDDIETLAGALIAQGLVDGRAVPAGPSLEQVLRGTGDPSAPRPSADELAAALLARVGPPKNRSVPSPMRVSGSSTPVEGRAPREVAGRA